MGKEGKDKAPKQEKPPKQEKAPKNKAIPYFWEHFDKANYSIWICEYKYPDELNLSFQTENLIGGMFQRLDKLNKNAFANMIFFGGDKNAQIQGLWVWRGQDLVFDLSENWQIDYESYDWYKLDIQAESTKKHVEKFFLGDECEDFTYEPFVPGSYEKYVGHKIKSCRIFK